MKEKVYYILVIILVLFANYIIVIFKFNDQNNVINNILREENISLKEEINELSNLNYHNYDYILGKITIKNIYQSNTYYIEPSAEVKNNSPVINNTGLIGLYNNHLLLPTKSLNLSIKINDIYGTLKDSIITITHSNYKEGESIYTSGLTNIPGGILIGTIKSIYSSSNSLEDTIEVNYLKNDTTYVGILTNYA